MKPEIADHAASAASASPGMRALIGGGLAAFGGGASHWIDWINSGMSMLVSICGLAAILYGVYRQRQQKAAEEAREAREVELHALQVEDLRLRLRSHQSPPPP